MPGRPFTPSGLFFLVAGLNSLISGLAGEISLEVVTLEDCAQFVEKGGARLVDARPPDLYRRGHIPGAMNLPLDSFERAYAENKVRLGADFAQLLMIYCTSLYCQDSGKVREKLKALGYTEVAVFKEGYAAWWKAGLPVEKSP